MTTEESNSDDEGSGDLAALTEMLDVSVLSGVVVIPLILPLPKEAGSVQRALFAKFQIHDREDSVLYEAMVPIDVLTMLSLNLIKACRTAVENIGEVNEQDMLFVRMKDLRERTLEASESLEILTRRFDIEND